MFRTHQNDTLMHIISLGCMVVAIGVTGFLYSPVTEQPVEPLLSAILLFPVYVIKFLTPVFIQKAILGNPSLLFLVLWLSYSLVAIWLFPLLRVTNYSTEELRSWYFQRIKSR